LPALSKHAQCKLQYSTKYSLIINLKTASALFKTYAAELVGLTPDAILAAATPGVAALRQQTGTIRFVLVADPVGQGFVQSLARPGGNVAGSAPSTQP
jgi:ABC-type uncharacterized transport system substrate-binding protein